MSTALSKPYKLSGKDMEIVSWITTAGQDDTVRHLKELTGTPRCFAIVHKSIEVEKGGAKRPTRLKLMEAALKRFGKGAALPLQGESTGPDWTRARAILQGIKTLVRMTLAGQVMLGHELQTLKVELGFAGRGGDRSKPKDSVLKSLNRTWEQWCNAELGISPDGADNFIKCFEAAKLRVKKHGGQTKLLGLMETHPAKLTKEDSDLLGGMVDRLLHGETQRALLDELKIFKKASTTTGGDTSASKKKVQELAAEQLAFAFFGKATSSITKLEKHVQNLRVAPDYEGFLHTLPLHREGPDGLSLHGLKITLETALTGDLPKMLEDVKAAIAAAEKGAAA